VKEAKLNQTPPAPKPTKQRAWCLRTTDTVGLIVNAVTDSLTPEDRQTMGYYIEGAIQDAYTHGRQDSGRSAMFEIAPPAPAELTVEQALAELREMFPNEWLITIDKSWKAKAEYCDESQSVRIGLRATNRHFMGATLTEVMVRIREWKEQDGLSK